MEPSLRSAAITDPSMRPILDWIDSYVSWEKLPEETRAYIATRAHAGDEEAQTALENHNLRLVLDLAGKRVGRGVPLADLVQEGWIGLRIAAGRYDPNRGTRFSTMATWWIRRALRNAIVEQGRAIRLPHKTVEVLSRIRMVQTTGEPLRLADQKWLDRLACKLTGNKHLRKVTLDYVEQILRGPASLDKTLPHDTHGGTLEHRTLMDYLEAPPQILAGESAHIGSVLVEMVNLKKLRPRDAWMLIRFHGLDGQVELSMPQIAEELFAAERRARVKPVREKPMTREAVRQCIERARRQLRVYLEETQPGYFVSPPAHGTLKKQTTKGLSGTSHAGQSTSTESPKRTARRTSVNDSLDETTASRAAAPTPLRAHDSTKRRKRSSHTITADGTRTSDTALGA